MKQCRALLCCALFVIKPAFSATNNFIDNGDGTIKHNKTGLVWKRCAEGQVWDAPFCTGTATTHTYAQATALTSNFAGQSDWRLPNIAELQTIVAYGLKSKGGDPAINFRVFPSGPYETWTSSTVASDSSRVWLIGFLYGVSYAGLKGSSLPVRLVRGGQPMGILGEYTPTAAFTDHGNGTVTHQKTGLMWQRCAVGQVWNGSTCSGAASGYTHTQARALSSNLAGYNDWRLPEADELLGIVEYKNFLPACNATIFPNTASAPFWSSSSFPSSSVHPYAWYVNFNYGEGGGYDAGYGYGAGYVGSDIAFVRLVRGGQFVLQPAEQVSGGMYHTLQRKNDGSVWAWGSNGAGELGDGTMTDSKIPKRVAALTGGSIDVSAGSEHSLAIKKDGTVWAWGYNAHGQLGSHTASGWPIAPAPRPVPNITNAVDVAASMGGEHSLAVTGDGTVWAWGNNSAGQLGDGTTDGHAPNHAPVAITVGGTGKVIRVAAGGSHSLALKDDGTVWAWGNGALGQLGSVGNSLVPKQVPGLSGIRMISAGIAHNLALKDDGSVWAWGDNFLGQLGVASSLAFRAAPEAVAGLPAITSTTEVYEIAAGGRHSMVKLANGSLWGWGANTSGQISNAPASGLNVATPTQIMAEVAGIGAGMYNSFALRVHGPSLPYLQAWGSNGSGELGNKDAPMGMGVVGIGPVDVTYPTPVGTVTSFSDNPTINNPFYNHILAMAEAGITSGCGNGNFCADQTVNRGQMAAFIIRALEGESSPACTAGDTLFNDVPMTNGFCKYIKRMNALGITSGVGNNLYGIDLPVTRWQMAAFIMRALEGATTANNAAATACSTSSGFGDVAQSHGFCGHMKRLAEFNVTSGCAAANPATGTLASYCPDATVTRGQMAAFISRAFLGLQ